jgi:diguanylate cyclase (GGDEF)-like protein
MELKIYLRILWEKRWIILPTFLIAFAFTVVLTFTQVPVYRATATFVVSPYSSLEEISVFLNMLEIKSQVANTYSELALSRAVKQQVAEELNLSPVVMRNYVIQSKLRGGTNVIEIAVEGRNPVLAAELANRLGERTIAYVQQLYQVYSLRSLDPAIPPTEPIRPNKKLNLAFGALLELALGVGLAFLSEYLQGPLENIINLNILDEESGTYNKVYLAQRLSEEMSRAKRNKYPLSLALMNVDLARSLRTPPSSQFRSEALHQVTGFLKQHLREEDVIAHLDGTTFAFLLPDMPEERAKVVMEELRTRMAWTVFEVEKGGIRLNLAGTAVVVAYDNNGMGPVELLERANRALQQADRMIYDSLPVMTDAKATALAAPHLPGVTLGRPASRDGRSYGHYTEEGKRRKQRLALEALVEKLGLANRQRPRQPAKPVAFADNATQPRLLLDAVRFWRALSSVTLGQSRERLRWAVLGVGLVSVMIAAIVLNSSNRPAYPVDYQIAMLSRTAEVSAIRMTPEVTVVASPTPILAETTDIVPQPTEIVQLQATLPITPVETAVAGATATQQAYNAIAARQALGFIGCDVLDFEVLKAPVDMQIVATTAITVQLTWHVKNNATQSYCKWGQAGQEVKLLRADSLNAPVLLGVPVKLKWVREDEYDLSLNVRLPVGPYAQSWRLILPLADFPSGPDLEARVNVVAPTPRPTATLQPTPTPRPTATLQPTPTPCPVVIYDCNCRQECSGRDCTKVCDRCEKDKCD